MAMAQWNRRTWIKGVGASGPTLALGGLSELALAQKNLTIGMIYVGPKDDFGYNQSHYEAASEIRKMPGITISAIPSTSPRISHPCQSVRPDITPSISLALARTVRGVTATMGSGQMAAMIHHPAPHAPARQYRPACR